VQASSGNSLEPTPSNHPTPLYNTALLTNYLPRSQLLAIHSLKDEASAFADALTLLRVWANQRGYGPGQRLSVRGFEDRGFWWAAVLELAVLGEEKWGSGIKGKRRPLGRGLSSYQLFRAALDFLCGLAASTSLSRA
jgi:U3 small nucleolar RNA-associated protein 22